MPPPPKTPDDLYALPLEEFVGARTSLAKTKREEGRRDEARELAALRKPSVAAWAVNQLVRSQPGAIRKLLRAGDELQRIQSELLAGKADRERLPRALAGERQAVDELLERARGLLTGAGQELSPTTLDRVAATLHAAAVQADARSALQAGRLERELEHAGLGGAAMLSGSRQAPRGKKRDNKTDADGRAKDKQAEQARTARLKAAGQAEASARRAAERAERDLKQAQARQTEAARSLQEAEDALAAERQRAERARAEHLSAQAALHEAQDNG
jgi:hypothetical protein